MKMEEEFYYEDLQNQAEKLDLQFARRNEFLLNLDTLIKARHTYPNSEKYKNMFSVYEFVIIYGTATQGDLKNYSIIGLKNAWFTLVQRLETEPRFQKQAFKILLAYHNKWQDYRQKLLTFLSF